MGRVAEKVSPHLTMRVLGLAWGLLGLFGLLVEAIVRLTPLALEPVREGMTLWAWGGYLGFVAFNAYAEGFRGFQRAFSPRVAVRAQILLREPSTAQLWLAPFFLMGLYDATRKRLLINWGLCAAIVVLVLLVRGAPQPLRGIIDAGVIAGLAWGSVATVICLGRALRGEAASADPELALAPTPRTTQLAFGQSPPTA